MGRNMNILAENLAAAYIAANMGLKSLDYAKKRYVQGDEPRVGDFWLTLAKDITAALTDVSVDTIGRAELKQPEIPAGGRVLDFPIRR